MHRDNIAHHIQIEPVVVSPMVTEIEVVLDFGTLVAIDRHELAPRSPWVTLVVAAFASAAPEQNYTI